MKTIITSAALSLGLIAILPICAALAQDDALPAGFETQPVLKTTDTRDGDAIAWPDGTPEIVSVIGTIEPGGRTPLHQHPVPVYVYVLEGEVELRTEGGDPHTYATGEAYVEALNRDHQLFNVTDSEARVLVVFAAAQGQPTTVASE
ncbi:cupin domain-containing protein [Billgrantia sp. C5P2]|uniref:cupin domain-containing protein n=1 Tax=Billgrantia sp. C5P2 TaxID=3436239 RepID=UPI003DA2A031